MAAGAGLWEREHAIGAIGRLVERSLEGAGGCLIIRGEAGLGKTSVLIEGARMAEPHMRVASTRADAMESWFPFGLIAPALLGLGGPDLLRSPGDLPVGPDVRASRFMAVMRWLQKAAGRPILLVLDDLHWGDPDSLALIAFLARRLNELPVALLGSLRPWPSQAEELVSNLAKAGNASVEQLTSLSLEAASAMITAGVGHPVAEDVLQRAQWLCAGNPLLLEQITLIIQRGEEVPELRGSGLPPAHGLLLARFAGLPMEGLRCAEAGSVLGGSFRAEIAAEIAQLDPGADRGAVEALSRSGLVRSVAGSILEFVHPLFAQTLYDELAPAVRALLHRRAFLILSRQGLETEAAEHAVRGDLVGDRQAIALLESAGRRALSRGAPAAAVTHLAGAAGLAAEHASPELLLMLGQAQLSAGSAIADARVTFERLLASTDLPELTKGEALRLLARTLYLLGQVEAANSTFEEAVSRLRVNDPSAAAAALLEDSMGAWLTTGPASALVLATRAQELSISLDDATRHRTGAIVGFMRMLTGDATGLEAIATAARVVESDASMFASDVLAGIAVLNLYAIAAGLADRFSEAERVFTLGLTAATRAGSAVGIASFSNPQAWLLTRMGRLDEALQLVGRSAEVADLAPYIGAYAAVGHAHVLQLMGRLDESDAWGERVETLAVPHGSTNAQLFLAEVRGQRALREGRFRQAAAHYAALESLVERTGYREPCFGTWARHAIAAHLGCDQEADALRVLDWLESCAKGLPCIWPRIAAATGRALLAQGCRDHDAAEAEFRTALALHEGTQQPIEEAETLLDYGAFLRRTGNPIRARPLLARALKLAEDSNAMWIAGYARAELIVAGGRRRRHGPLELLTAQERRVAELAAAGLSNREMAARLSLAITTIDTHLQRIYAKLDIHSRRELMTMGTHSFNHLTPARTQPPLSNTGPAVPDRTLSTD